MILMESFGAGLAGTGVVGGIIAAICIHFFRKQACRQDGCKLARQQESELLLRSIQVFIESLDAALAAIKSGNPNGEIDDARKELKELKSSVMTFLAAQTAANRE